MQNRFFRDEVIFRIPIMFTYEISPSFYQEREQINEKTYTLKR